MTDLEPTDTRKLLQRRQILAGAGVTLVLDVGANAGQYARSLREPASRYQGRIVSFEPVAASCDALRAAAAQDPLWEVRQLALSDQAGQMQIHVPDGHSDLSSFHSLSAQGTWRAGERLSVQSVAVARLDDLLDDLARPDDVIALHLDVQGHQAAVMRGAQRVLRRAVTLESEVPLVPLYDGVEDYGTTMELIAAGGFSPVGMWSNWVDPGSGFAADADVFFRRR